MRILTWAITLLSLACFSLTEKYCYYPNGQIAVSDSPCNPNADDSACCDGDKGMMCMSNNLCRGPGGTTVRSSCTDKSWDSTACAALCMTENTVPADLTSCANVTGSDTTYCCDNHRVPCCDASIARFDVLPSKPQIFAIWDDSASAYLSINLPGTATTTATTTTSSSPAYPTDPPPSNTQPSSTPSNPPSPDAASAAALSLAVQAGIGVGAAVLALALAVVVYLVVKLRRNKNAVLAAGQRGQAGAVHGQYQGGVGVGGYDGWENKHMDKNGGGVGNGGGGAAAWYHPPAYGEPYHGGSGFGVVPRQELDAWPSVGYGQPRRQRHRQSHGQGYVQRFELPATPLGAPRRAF
ncbi:hypothetical protein CHGG_09866 [Chaetomium globosum CBS 148.51]|uniref:Mid2 domain-containing protein n=1 Tax=Chaetomium globosum (strain ATCC 6205 / CBS 148.51 / DSM 1962 / NBRC 6347 / NRRL 1970) TaxID=306901 RepID=Q2GQ88_CHAGB|nr:uncharacterized protein CHGG_09866 [Chaetomium globosum CBS 148.51]EAQ83462.1 hypothetical protein CHGG_09866 [Chaetomium globosum CBS 148.51]